jgi:hypothetical protein
LRDIPGEVVTIHGFEEAAERAIAYDTEAHQRLFEVCDQDPREVEAPVDEDKAVFDSLEIGLKHGRESFAVWIDVIARLQGFACMMPVMNIIAGSLPLDRCGCTMLSIGIILDRVTTDKLHRGGSILFEMMIEMMIAGIPPLVVVAVIR